MKKVGHIISW